MTPEEQAGHDDALEQRAKALQRLRDRHGAYLAVFGPLDKPVSAAAAFVLADIERFARYEHTPSYRPRTLGDFPGPMDPYGTIYNVALQDFVKRIHQAIGWSEEHDDSSSSVDG